MPIFPGQYPASFGAILDVSQRTMGFSGLDLVGEAAHVLPNASNDRQGGMVL
jgi:hypothetical protein